MRYFMKLNPEPFGKIKSKIKTIELRLNDEKRQMLKINDEIEFSDTEDNNNKILTKVVDIYHFSSFKELYDTLPLLKCGYTVETIHMATHKDMDKYYSKENQKKYGVVGIEIELIE